jgi:hypothetical protein
VFARSPTLRPPIILGDENKAREVLGYEANTDLKNGMAASIAVTGDPRALTAATKGANTVLSGHPNS